MARFTVHGLDKLIDSFEAFAELPDDVVDDMMQAAADVVVKAQSDKAKSMLQGPYYKGAVSAGVRKSKVFKTKGGHGVFINFEGTQHGNRLAEIAFVNEYGKTNQPARPFIRMANEQSAEQATEAAAKVYENYLHKNGF